MLRRSDFKRKYSSASAWKGPSVEVDAELAAKLAEEAGVIWEPEEPEGFNEWFEANRRDQEGKNGAGWALAGWRACLARQEAQERTNAAQPDPEARRREIEAQIEAWAEFQAGLAVGARAGGATPSPYYIMEWAAAGRGLLRNYLRLEGY